MVKAGQTQVKAWRRSLLQASGDLRVVLAAGVVFRRGRARERFVARLLRARAALVAGALVVLRARARHALPLLAHVLGALHQHRLLQASGDLRVVLAAGVVFRRGWARERFVARLLRARTRP